MPRQEKNPIKRPIFHVINQRWNPANAIFWFSRSESSKKPDRRFRLESRAGNVSQKKF